MNKLLVSSLVAVGLAVCTGSAMASTAASQMHYGSGSVPSGSYNPYWKPPVKVINDDTTGQVYYVHATFHVDGSTGELPVYYGGQPLVMPTNPDAIPPNGDPAQYDVDVSLSYTQYGPQFDYQELTPGQTMTIHTPCIAASKSHAHAKPSVTVS